MYGHVWVWVCHNVTSSCLTDNYTAPARSRPGKDPFADLPRPKGAEELEVPEELSDALKADAGPLISAFGEYVTRALYAKQWNLREAAVHKAVTIVEAPGADWARCGQGCMCIGARVCICMRV